MSALRWLRLLGVAAIASIAGVFAPAGAGAADAPAAKTVDHVRDLIDLYFQGRERDRFFDAAGVDGELSEAEFAAAAGKPSSFVRPYDRWPAAVVFDRDRDGRLDWVEAEQYRLALRKRVLALFDRDRDGRLNGPEREAANAYLSAGMGTPRLPRRTTSAPARPATRPSPDQWAALAKMGSPADPAWRRQWQQLRDSSDVDDDGKLSEQERSGMYAALREHYRKRLLERFDKNGDGALTGAEQQAVEQALRAEAEEARRQSELAQWDADKDGGLSPAERAAMEKHFAEQLRLAEQRRREWLARWDTDRDGKLSRQERAAITAEHRRKVAERRKQMDANGDGKITAEEIRAYRKKLFEELRRSREQPDRPGGGEKED